MSDNNTKTTIVLQPQTAEAASQSQGAGQLSPSGLVGLGLAVSPADWEPPEPAEFQAWISQTGLHWQIEKLQARGAMGAVYKAYDTRDQHPIAIKLMRPRDPVREWEYFQNFKQEILVLLRTLNHPGIVRVFEWGEHSEPGSCDESGVRAAGRAYVFYSMEWIDGGTLASYVISHKEFLENEVAVVALFTQIATAVAEIHRQGIVHQDLKPDNIMVTSGGRVKVIDFSLAKKADRERDGMLVQGEGLIGGSPGYRAPEQEQPDARVDERSDVYALGVIFYELLVASVANAGRNAGEKDQWPPASQVAGTNPRFDAIIRQCLQDDARQRYESAGALLREVEWALSAEQQEGRIREQFRINRRLRLRLAAVVCMSIVAVIAGVFAWWQMRALENAHRITRATKNTAESLVESMLGELRLSLEEAGRLDLLDQITRSVHEYFDHLPASEWDSSSERRRAWMFKYRADVARMLGHHEEADQDYFNHADILRHLHEADPDNAPLAREHAQAIGETGKVWERLGQLDRAGACFDAQLKLLGQLPATAAPDAETVIARAAAWENLGFLEVRRGQSPAAEICFVEQVKLFETMLDGQAGDPRFQRNLAKSHGNLGDLFLRSRDYAKALPRYTQQKELLDDLSGNAPEDMRLFFDLAVAWNRLGKVHLEAGGLDKAQVAFEQFHAKMLHLHESVDPSHPGYLRAYSTSLANLGEVALRRSDTAGAEARFREDLQITRRLAARYPDDPTYAADLALSVCNLAGIHRLKGDLVEWEKCIREARGIEQRIKDLPEATHLLERLSPTIEKVAKPLTTGETTPSL